MSVKACEGRARTYNERSDETLLPARIPVIGEHPLGSLKNGDVRPSLVARHLRARDLLHHSFVLFARLEAQLSEVHACFFPGSEG